MQSKSPTVEHYLASLPDDRRAAIQAVREVILKNLDKDISEQMQYGMIGYAIPHSVFPHGYHCDPKQPLCFAGLASQKSHMSLYLMCIYGNSPENKRLVEDWKKSGKKLDMGKACIRFKSLDDVPLDVIGAAIKRNTAKKYIECYTAALASVGKGPDGKRLPASAVAKSSGTPDRSAAPRTKSKAAGQTSATPAAKSRTKSASATPKKKPRRA